MTGMYFLAIFLLTCQWCHIWRCSEADTTS